jgi:hypothetical protein
MKKAVFVLAVCLLSGSVYGQITVNGNIIFANRNIPTLSGTGGGNGNGTYNVPFWECSPIPGVQTGNGAGDLAGGVTVGLFQAGSTTPLATTLLRTDANSQFFATSAMPVEVPGVAPGQSAALVVRVWQGASLAAAKSGGLQWLDETVPGAAGLAFTSRPLGGTPPTPGSTPVPTPNMTGWGPEDGTGFQFVCIPEPSTCALAALGIGALLLRRRKAEAGRPFGAQPH